MIEYKLVISEPSTGKAYRTEVKDAQAEVLVRKRIGDSVAGDALSLVGYELKVTGGSDKSGFPMRSTYHGVTSKRLLLAGGVGCHPTHEGGLVRRRVCGDTITDNIAQINLVVEKAGPKKLGEIFPPAEKKETAEKK